MWGDPVFFLFFEITLSIKHQDEFRDFPKATCIVRPSLASFPFYIIFIMTSRSSTSNILSVLPSPVSDICTPRSRIPDDKWQVDVPEKYLKKITLNDSFIIP